MGLEQLAQLLHQELKTLVGLEWLATALTVVIALAITALVSHLVTKALRRMLSHDSSPLPSSSIIVNVARVFVWLVGASVILSTQFGIDVTAAITALGVGGIAISLGFQDTLSNLIGGLQVSLTGLVEPGDHIEVGGQRGTVKDVTWRHTTIETAASETVVIPNSVINKSSLIKLRPTNCITVALVVTKKDLPLKDIVAALEETADRATAPITAVQRSARALFAESTVDGYKGTLTIWVEDASKSAEVKNAILSETAALLR